MSSSSLYLCWNDAVSVKEQLPWLPPMDSDNAPIVNHLCRLLDLFNTIITDTHVRRDFFKSLFSHLTELHGASTNGISNTIYFDANEFTLSKLDRFMKSTFGAPFLLDPKYFYFVLSTAKSYLTNDEFEKQLDPLAEKAWPVLRNTAIIGSETSILRCFIRCFEDCARTTSQTVERFPLLL